MKWIHLLETGLFWTSMHNNDLFDQLNNYWLLKAVMICDADDDSVDNDTGGSG